MSWMAPACIQNFVAIGSGVSVPLIRDLAVRGNSGAKIVTCGFGGHPMHTSRDTAHAQ